MCTVCSAWTSKRINIWQFSRAILQLKLEAWGVSDEEQDMQLLLSRSLSSDARSKRLDVSVC